MEDDAIKESEINSRWRAHIYRYIKLRKSEEGKGRKYTPENYCNQARINLEGFTIWLRFLEKEDKYVFYQSFALEYLKRALSSINLLERHMDSELSMPLMRDAIIAYAAPFSKSKGRVGSKWSLKELEDVIPDSLQDLHKKIISDRNEIVAHCDLSPRNPTLCFLGIVIKGQGYYWNDYKKLLPDFKNLISFALEHLKEFNKANFISQKMYFQEFVDSPKCTEEDPGPVNEHD